MPSHRSFRIRPLLLTALLATTACGAAGNNGASDGSTSTGGSSGSGGTSASGGTTDSGGALGSGGKTASGGTTSSGGTSASGGTTASGGATGSGGAPGTGGTTASGGATASGGQGTAGASGSGGAAGAPVSALPPLHVDGPLIKDPDGKTIVLRGVSLIDLGSLYAYGGQTAAAITARVDKILAAGLSPHVVRLPVYPRTCFNTGGDPFNSPTPFPVGTAATSGTHADISADDYYTKLLKPTVDYLARKNIYAIIDYHQIDNSIGQSGTDATTFWQYMAAKFANVPNVIYEAYNEPIDGSTNWATFKPRAQGWVDTIRAAASDNLIIVPSMSYDQHPGDAASSPLTGTNLVYTAHIYPGNWNSTFKQQVATAVTKVPVFMTEWGYIQGGSDSNLGTPDATWGAAFQTLIDGNGASWTAWVADDGWTPNMFASGSSLATLSPFGTLAKSWLTDKITSDWVQ